MRISLLICFALMCCGSAWAAEPSKPNIIFILADDLGWTDLGCQGSKFYETPHIDRLAQQGMRLTSAYTCGPNCTPTRAALMTGKYGARTGLYTVGAEARGQSRFRKLVPVPNETRLPLEEVTLAEVLKGAGYRTALFGKWHLGEDPQHHPSRQGFDEAIATMGRHFNFNTRPPTKVNPDVYLADFLTDQSLRFIEQNKDRPFFLYLAHFAVHVPHEAKKELVAKFTNKPGVNGHKDPVYAAMIASLDESVGRIMAKLDELKLAERTIIIFTSDNGGVGGYNAAGIRANDHTNNAPLRGGKGMLYEGGIRVPFIVRWSGVIQPGSVCDEALISVDALPTFAELAGAQLDPKIPLDGVSLAQLWRTSGRERLQRDAIFWHFPGYLEANVLQGTWRTTPVSVIRSGDFKLLEFLEDNRIELYNVRDDISEKRNLADALPGKAKELREKLHAWRKSVNAPMPTPNPEYAPPGRK